LKKDDMSLDLLKELFAVSQKNPKAKFEPNDRVQFSAKEYYNDKLVTTTVGRFIVNKCLLEPKIIQLIGYQDIVINKKTMKGLDQKIIDECLLTEKITMTDYHEYLDQCNWLAYGCTYFIVPSLDTSMFIVDKEITDMKQRLIEENKEAVQNNDVSTIFNIEQELLKASKEKVKDIPGYQIYASGARGSFDNNYKNSCLMRGSVMNFTDPSKFEASMASLVDGIPKEDFHIYANILTAGTYARAKNTEVGGYLVKQSRSGYQHLMLDEKDSDCGTKKFLEITLTDKNKGLFLLRWIQGSDGKLVLLDADNIKQYIGKKVKIRSPLYCTNDRICSKCAGELYYKLGMTNIGLIGDRIASTIMQKSMKQFHDSTIKTTKIDYESHMQRID